MDAVKPGTRLQDKDTGVGAIVVKCSPESDIEIRTGAAVALGKRYTCETCDAQVLVTQAGRGELTGTCHGAVMAVTQPKLLPSSD